MAQGAEAQRVAGSIRLDAASIIHEQALAPTYSPRAVCGQCLPCLV